MGVKIYWMIIVAVIILGLIMPQKGYYKKYYVILMAGLHTFVCGFRYMYLVGDLRKYAAGYYDYANGAASWFDQSVFNGGRNAGFEWLKKIISMVTNGDFQIFLIILAIITEVALAVLIYKYSPKPWLSYLVWNCMAFYVSYDFCAIKQGLAMAVLMFAAVCIFEKKPIGFFILTLIAGFIHMPALIFLPAYWLMGRKINWQSILSYIIVAIVIYIFRDSIVEFFQETYYMGNDEVSFTLSSDGIGGRFVVIIMIALIGLVLRGFKEKNFEGLFNIIIVAAILQMFSVYSNVFTRLADYYLQFVVLFIPMIFYESDHEVAINKDAVQPLLPFNQKSIKLIVILMTIILIWWYYRTCIGVKIDYEPDDYTNFRFMWDVIQ